MKKTHSTSAISKAYLTTLKTIKGVAVCVHRCLALVHHHPRYHSIYDERMHRFTKPMQTLTYPSVNDIGKFIQSIDEVFKFPSEVYVTASIYMDRLATISHIHLSIYTWRRILLVAIVVAAKFNIDGALKSGDFVQVFPHVKDIVILEKEFLKHIQFGLFIERLHFSNYYFAVNSMELVA
uniref:Cyclin N-terminal domain-containing protein n=1 Tax=Arcella intermedia TaxID=1963864 RepID=A0A6B2LL76_9EUKA